MSANDEFFKIKTFKDYKEKIGDLVKDLDQKDPAIIEHLDKIFSKPKAAPPPEGVPSNMQWNGRYL